MFANTTQNLTREPHDAMTAVAPQNAPMGQLDPRGKVSLPVVGAQVATTVLFFVLTIVLLVLMGADMDILGILLPFITCVICGSSAFLGFMAFSNPTQKSVDNYLNSSLFALFALIAVTGYTWTKPPVPEVGDEIEDSSAPSPVALKLYKVSPLFFLIAAVPLVVAVLYGYRRGGIQDFLRALPHREDNVGQGRNQGVNTPTQPAQSAGPAPTATQDPYATDYGPPTSYGFN